MQYQKIIIKLEKFMNILYKVRLPWNEQVVELTDNYGLAKNKLHVV